MTLITTRRLLQAAAMAGCLLLAACGGSAPSGPPPEPQLLTDQAVGHYCGMNLTEHIGPKGQILLRDQDQAVWFSTIREVFAYTLLPEEPKTIVAIYVQDMGQADPNGNPPADAWIDARTAHFLIESRAVGGMGAPDALPFARSEDAQAFAQRHGGRVLSFQDVPEDYILRYQEPSPSALRLTDTDTAPKGSS
ncbi:nitrous oxide reductase accessory protein NosL [Castellaniella sp.]|uniref:nitrous oxide reductase accessory protein NosL n=1 Tax=Castellaniella sp. TaxID=1955812 RepID=UPI002AFFD356|nr:nitrous oxide reductase accessory protein NosL [Castellaniella sp.]